MDNLCIAIHNEFMWLFLAIKFHKECNLKFTGLLPASSINNESYRSVASLFRYGGIVEALRGPIL
ncbi:hypothetical protein [uncultured Croceitalea sp.]|uniref:hypothetical protein n=1 Tax=uncultured Croceitalea sp. TaxID=1798908 RepID=UPI003305A341